MKQHITIIAIICILLTCHFVSPAYAEVLFSTGARYDRFSDDLTPKTSGFEITVPIGIAYKQKNYSISVENAYSNATADRGDEDEASLSGVTDTLVSVSYTYRFTNRPMGLIVGLDVNLPTGKAHLNEQERIAEAGESNDLFEVDNFGDGLNIGLSVGLMRDIGKASLGVQGAYIFNGEYDPTRDTPEDDLDPGDQILALALLGWQASARLTLNAFMAYSHFSPDKVNGQKTFQEGGNVVAGGNVLYERGPLGIVVSAQGTLQSKNDEVIEDILQTEPANSNGSDFFGLIEGTYRPSQKLVLRLLGDIRYYGESDRKDESSELPYEGKRIRYAAGPGFVYSLTKRISCDGLFKYFIMTQDPDITVDQEITFQGMNLDVGLTYTF